MGYYDAARMDEDDKNELSSMIKKTTISNAKSMLKKILKTNITPFLWGPPCVGKSSLIAEICKEEGKRLIDLRLSLLSPVDLRGLPIIDRENNNARWLSPSFLPPQDAKDEGILFLDEINLAPPSVQSAAFQLILDKRIGEYVFPPTWRIVAAGNREIDKSNVFRLSAPLMNRFMHMEITEDLGTWLPWAKNNVRNEVYSFISTRPNLLLQMPQAKDKAFPSPRTWKFLSEILDCFEYVSGSSVEDDLEKAIFGTIGQAAGSEFVKFIQSNDMQEVGKLITSFKAGNDITLPKNEDSRYAILEAILRGYADGELKKDRVEQLKTKLTAEERAMVENWQKRKGL